MAHHECSRSDDLQHRIEALEAKLSRLEAPPPTSRAGSKRFLAIAAAVIPTIAVAGLAVAQQDGIPAPTPPEPGPGQDVIRKIGATTQVMAPFQVVDPSGKVILKVAADVDQSALVSISNHGGLGGNVAIASPGGTTVGMLGLNTDGNGIVIVHDPQGTPRAFVRGSGGVYVHNKSGKQVAGLVATAEDKGRVAVWGSQGGGERIAEFEEAGSGSGVVRIYNSGHKQIALVGPDENGKGTVFIVDQDRTAAALSINNAGAGQLVLSKADGSLGLEAVGTSQRSGYAPGGVISAFGDGGVVAGFGVGTNGRGAVSLINAERAIAELSINNAGAGELTLGSAEGNEGLSAAGAQSAGAGGSLIVSNGAGERVAGLMASSTGKGSLMIFDKDHPAAELNANEKGAGELTLSNGTGGTALQASGASATADGGGIIAFNKSSEPVASLGASADGKGEITVAEKAREVAKLTSNATGAGSINLMTSEGKVGLDASGQNAAGASGGSVTVFNGAGQLVAGLGTTDEGMGRIRITEGDTPIVEMVGDSEQHGGLVNTMDSSGNVIAAMGVSDEGKGRVAVYGKSGGLATLSDSAGAGVVWVKNAQDQITAGLMGGNGNAGAVLVMDSSGQAASEMSVEAGRGRVVVWNPGGKNPAAMMARSPIHNGGLVQVGSPRTDGVGILTVGALGEGFLQLTDASGTPMVAAGTTKDGRGRVDAGPGNRCAPTHMGLVVPDCIMGPAK